MQLKIRQSDGETRTLPLDPAKQLRVGSDTAADVTLVGADVHRIHCGFLFKDGSLHVAATKAVGKIEVNGKPVAHAAVKQGDKIRIGGHEIEVLADAAAKPANTLLDDELGFASEAETSTPAKPSPSKPQAPKPQAPQPAKPTAKADELPQPGGEDMGLESLESLDDLGGGLEGLEDLSSGGLGQMDDVFADLPEATASTTPLPAGGSLPAGPGPLGQPTAGSGALAPATPQPEGKAKKQKKGKKPRKEKKQKASKQQAPAAAAPTMQFGQPLSPQLGQQQPLQQPPATPQPASQPAPQAAPAPKPKPVVPKRPLLQPATAKIGAVLLLLAIPAAIYAGVLFVKPTEEERFSAADERYRAKSYGEAAARFDEYLEQFPAGDRADYARVKRGLAQLHPVVAKGDDWPSALQAAEEVVAGRGGSGPHDAVQPELDELLPKIAANLVNRAVLLPRSATADQRQQAIAQAEQALALVKAHTTRAAQAQHNVDRLELQLIEVQQQSIQSAALDEALANIESDVGKAELSSASEHYWALLDRYPQFATDPRLLQQTNKLAAAALAAVTVNDASRPAETNPESSPVTLAVAARETTLPLAASGGVVAVLSQDHAAAYGLDAATGQLLWRRFVGFDQVWPPVLFGGNKPSGALLTDAADRGLVCVDARSGQRLWQQPLVRIDAAPVIAQNAALVAAQDGILSVVELPSGDISASYEFGLPLTVGPAADDANRIYQLADNTWLYVIDGAQEQSVAAAFIGHRPGSVTESPVLLDKHLLVFENVSVKSSQIHVISNEGNPRVIQTLSFAGNASGPPVVTGNTILAVSDDGSLDSFQYDAKSSRPLRSAASSRAGVEAQSPASYFATIRDSQLWVAGRGLAIYDLAQSGGEFKRVDLLYNDATFMQPTRPIDGADILIQKDAGRSGLTVAAINPVDQSVRWNTRLSVPLAAQPIVSSDASFIMFVNADGDVFRVPLGGADTAGPLVVDDPIVRIRPGEPVGQCKIVRIGAATIVAWIGDDALFVLADSDGTGGQVREILLPGPLGRGPIPMGYRLLVAIDGGPVYLLDPATGNGAGQPYLPMIDVQQPPRWRGLAAAGDGAFILADEQGNLLRIARNESASPATLVAGKPVSLESPLASDLTEVGNRIWAINAAQQLVAFEGAELKQVATIDVGADDSLNLLPVGGGVIAATLDDRLLRFRKISGPDWTFQSEGRILGMTSIDDHSIAVVVSGGVSLVSIADGQTIGQSSDLGQALSGHSIAIGDQLFLATADGGFVRIPISDLRKKANVE